VESLESELKVCQDARWPRADTGSPVWDKYEPPFEFTGQLDSVTGSHVLGDHSPAAMRILGGKTERAAVPNYQ
jgi:hypothetical protein